MNLRKGLLMKKISVVLLAQTMIFSSLVSVSAAEVQQSNIESNSIGKVADFRKPSIKLEYLDRGLIATKTSEGVFLSWRLLANEVTGYSSTGLTGSNFNVYRDGVKIATVEDSTNYLDKGSDATSQYYVKAVVDGKEVDQSSTVSSWENNFYELKLKKPEDQKMPKGVLFPDGEVATYEANDMSVGDVDGDGQYEYFVKWYPSNAKDVSQRGYTGNTYIDCYKLDGTLLYRLDLGVNVRSGAHYTQFMVYDFDGDGKAETMMKTAPGTKIIKYDKDGNVTSEKYITMPQSDIDSGFKNTDDYRLSAEGYFNHVVGMFMTWDKHPEVVNGHWPKTIEECLGKTDKTYTYPLSKEDAAELANYFIDVYAPSRNVNNKLREFEGFILTGPEYLTVFNGESGAEMKTIQYKTERGDDGLLWGDYAMARIEPGNRVDRFLAGVAYLDGKTPYALFARGYYTRTTMVTYSWDGKDLKEYWYVDSGHAPMGNPFNSGPHGVNGSNPEYGNITTQGAHSLSVADVDGDGSDEIVYGSVTIDHDGKVLYSSYDILPTGSAAPGTLARLGHGDALHVTDIDPSRPGLEIFMCHEGATWAPYGSSLRDAKTGEVIYGLFRNKDNGRAIIGDLDPTIPGLERWSNGFWAADGSTINGTAPGTNANIKWAPDMTTQVVDGSGTTPVSIVGWDYVNTKKPVTVLATTGTLSNNGTKGNPSLVADVLGDWREELLVRNTDSSAIRIYTSTELTNHKLFTLMHDAQYRTDVARQNTGYNQPSYTSFYFASDTNWANVVPNLLIADKTTVDKAKTAQLAINDSSLAKGTIKYTSSNPSILDVDAQGKITTYTAGSAEVSAAITLNDIVVETNKILITVNDKSTAPVFDEIAPQSVDQGNFLQFKVNASSPKNLSLTYSVGNYLPAGATFDKNNQTLNWTPGVDQAGSYAISFNVTDGVTTIKKDVTIVVRDVPVAELVEKALVEKDFYHFNLAYYKVMKLSNQTEKAIQLDKLATIHDLIWNKDIADINKQLENLAATGSGKIYDDIQSVINGTNLSAVDKGYLLGEVTSWGKKLVFTSEYKAAVDALIYAAEKKDADSISKAERTIEKVTNTNSKEYLLGELANIKIIIE